MSPVFFIKEAATGFLTKTKGGGACVLRLFYNKGSAGFLKHLYRNITSAGFHGQIPIGCAQLKGSLQGNKA